MPTFATEQLSNCVLIIDELRRVLQCPPEVGLVTHARSIMDKLPNESSVRQLLVKMQEADPVLYEQMLNSDLGLFFKYLTLRAMGKPTVWRHSLLDTEEQAKAKLAQAVEEFPALEPHTSSGSEDHLASSP